MALGAPTNIKAARCSSCDQTPSLHILSILTFRKIVGGSMLGKTFILFTFLFVLVVSVDAFVARQQVSPRAGARAMSLFDEDPSSDPLQRKFTGQSDMTGEQGQGMSARDRMREQEFNLVSRSTSTEAFLGQAALIVAMLCLIVYVGATGQLGMNDKYYEDDSWVDPVAPSMLLLPDVDMMIPNEKPSVWL
jgi:hypothetical protein